MKARDIASAVHLSDEVLVVVRLGSFHTLKEALSTIYAENTIDYMASGHAYARAFCFGSGVEEVYSERDRCLQEIADMCADLTLAPPPKKRRTVSKEKQIIELGRKMRDNHSSVYLEIILSEHRGEEVIVDNVVAEEVESTQNTPCIPRTLDKAEDNKKQIMDMFIYPKCVIK
ncbi:unnamed protein product [Diabrotica balteata]|uniref:Uncharacterized protein n=1 Tax=Diabrotica balteata TaxID=107213 RepID=A0A9N9TCS3_DIABA|nr:unnamed protein product [Diabrotica balteata]